MKANPSLLVRMQTAVGQPRHLRTLLLALVVLCGSAMLILQRLPPTVVKHTLNDTELEAYSEKQMTDMYPDKCVIPDFETLRRMSVVYTWVNGSQPCYQQERIKFGGQNSVGGQRDREIGELKYSLRSFIKHMSWHIGPIYIVTPGHIPNWIDLNNSRVQVINQDDLIPDYAKAFLPTFNTHVIEQFLYRIPGVSDYYMQVNDDYVFTKPIDPHEFFTCEGGLRLLHERRVIRHQTPSPRSGAWFSSVLNTQIEMDLRWGTDEERHLMKHMPFVYSRRAFERIHSLFARPLYNTLFSKFRSKPDMNIPLLYHYYMLNLGSKELGIPISIPSRQEMNAFKLVRMKDNNQVQLKKLYNQVLDGTSPFKILALNDDYYDMAVADNAVDFLSSFLPNATDFELPEGAPPHPLTIRRPETCEIDPTILKPLPTQVSKDFRVQVVVEHKREWIIGVDALLRGFGMGVGLLIVYVFFLLVLRRRQPMKKMMSIANDDKV